MDIQTWLLFCSLAFIATITPGPAILLAVSHSLAYGPRNATFTILGNVSGLLVLCSLSVAGLSILILNSLVVFTAVKIVGAAYLIYLGLKLWRSGFTKAQPQKTIDQAACNRTKLYLNGLTVAISNPKAVAFTTALFPQFINHQGNIGVQFSLLIVTFMLLSFISIFFYAYTAGRTKIRFFHSASTYLSKLLGLGFIASGIALLRFSQKHS